MSQFLKNWTINILTLSIFISILEILIPKSNMKKYIEMIVGLLIIIVIINPFIKLVTSNIDIEREVFANVNKSNEMIDDKELSEIQKNQFTNIYLSKVKDDIWKIVEENSEYEVLDVVIEIETKDNENFGKVNKAYVKVKDNKSNTKPSNVEKVDVKVNSIKANSSVSKNITKEEIRLDFVEKIIKDRYKLHSDDILFYSE